MERQAQNGQGINMCNQCHKDKMQDRPPCFTPSKEYVQYLEMINDNQSYKTVYKPQELQQGYEIPDVILERK